MSYHPFFPLAGQAKLMKNMFRGMALLFLPFGSFVPSGVALLWASNSLFSVFLGVSLRQAAVRRAVGLPTLQELEQVGQKLQAAMSADPMSFVPPAPAAAPQPGAAGAAAPGAPGFGAAVPPPPGFNPPPPGMGWPAQGSSGGQQPPPTQK